MYYIGIPAIFSNFCDFLQQNRKYATFGFTKIQINGGNSKIAFTELKFDNYIILVNWSPLVNAKFTISILNHKY